MSEQIIINCSYKFYIQSVKMLHKDNSECTIAVHIQICYNMKAKKRTELSAQIICGEYARVRLAVAFLIQNIVSSAEE
jgi:hypothetical protein